MTWDIVTGLIVLISAVVSIGTVIFKLSKTLTTLTVCVDHLTVSVGELKESNKSDHAEIIDSVDEIANMVNDHETRIHDLERDKK